MKEIITKSGNYFGFMSQKELDEKVKQDLDVCEWRKDNRGNFASGKGCECYFHWDGDTDIDGNECPCCKRLIRVIEEEKDG